ncbi:MAG: hypothetical protein ACYDHH_07320 [Solirubrobacteraceae bacterium]
MRCILLNYQNTQAWNGLSQEDEDVFTHAAGKQGRPMLTFYEHPFALYCQKVLVALNDLGVAYDVLEERRDFDRADLAELSPARNSCWVSCASSMSNAISSRPAAPGSTRAATGTGSATARVPIRLLVEALQSADVGRQRQAGRPHRAQHRR